ncbi:uncharacterized protein DMAD_09465 [Drosophila madeirensis]|uniref:Uncharacterized protein n=1 Tax=Drosophila madeirensis TaxID=30013 RepID=A0AAU9F7X4_DROMD
MGSRITLATSVSTDVEQSATSARASREPKRRAVSAPLVSVHNDYRSRSPSQAVKRRRVSMARHNDNESCRGVSKTRARSRSHSRAVTESLNQNVELIVQTILDLNNSLPVWGR